jgi:hypothetical protein
VGDRYNDGSDRKVQVKSLAMPNVLRQDGFRIVIYLDDHLPSHVHVFRAEEEVKISLGSDIEPPQILELRGKPRTGVKALEIVMQHQTALLQAWENIHGQV